MKNLEMDLYFNTREVLKIAFYLSIFWISSNSRVIVIEVKEVSRDSLGLLPHPQDSS